MKDLFELNVERIAMRSELGHAFVGECAQHKRVDSQIGAVFGKVLRRQDSLQHHDEQCKRLLFGAKKKHHGADFGERSAVAHSGVAARKSRQNTTKFAQESRRTKN